MPVQDKIVSAWNWNNSNIDSINGNDANISGAIYSTDRHLGSHSISHDKVDDSIVIPAAPSLNIPSTIGLVSWVKATDSSYPLGNFYSVIHKTNNFWLSLGWPTTDRFSMNVYIGGGWRSATANVNFTTGWHLIVGLYDGTNIKIFIDNILRGITAQSGALTNSNIDIGIGNLTGGTLPTQALFDATNILGSFPTDGGVTTLGNPAGGEVAELWNGGVGLEFPIISGLPRRGLGRGLMRGLGRGL